MIADQDLGDLDGVEGRTLAQIVGDHPHVEPVRNGRVTADAAHINLVLADRLGRGYIAFVGAVVDDRDTRSTPQRGAGIVL
jgi:hypothetical protein